MKKEYDDPIAEIILMADVVTDELNVSGGDGSWEEF